MNQNAANPKKLLNDYQMVGQKLIAEGSDILLECNRRIVDSGFTGKVGVYIHYSNGIPRKKQVVSDGDILA